MGGGIMKIQLGVLGFALCLMALNIPAHSSMITGNVVYGIQPGDPVAKVRSQAKKYKFRIIEYAVNSEAGKETGLYLYKGKELILIAVILGNNVHWVDFLEANANYNGIVIGSKISDYLNDKFSVQFYGHRDCSLDDTIVIINGVKSLIGSEHWKAVSEFKAKKDAKALEGVPIKGVELEKEQE